MPDFIKKTPKSFKSYKAAAALIAILMIGGVITEVAIAGLFIVYFLGQSGLGVKVSSEALAAAESGVEDAILRVVRDRNFSTYPASYDLAVGDRSATITVCQNLKTDTSLCDESNDGKTEITSVGFAFNKRRQLRAVLNRDTATGEIQVESLKEVSF